MTKPTRTCRTAVDLDALRATMAACARPRYADATDPHDGNDTPGAPAIRFVNYMGDYDDYYAANLVGPYPSVAARDEDLDRLRGLPLGAEEYHGGYEFLPSTMGGDPGAEIVPPDRVAEATSVERFFAAFNGWGDDQDEPA